MKNNRKWTVSMGMVCLILGFIITVQFKSVLFNKTPDSTQIERLETLQEKYNEERDKSEALRGQLTQYKEELDRFRQEASASGSYASFLLKELEHAELLAGMTGVEGQGVRVIVRDGGKSIIHDGDLLLIVNELRDAGAEALSFNGERLLATSEIRCAGSVVSVNNVRYTAPFEICAIGNSKTMYDALFMLGGVVDMLSQWEIEIYVEQLDSLYINGYEGALQHKYAERTGE